ncbi:MAG: C1 family peptidase [Spirochaetia bacterium]|nr:C1 family peptidase [Spirochaetia bacterium]
MKGIFNFTTILCLSCLFFFSGCISKEYREKNKKWELESFPVTQIWEEKDTLYPMILSSLPPNPSRKLTLSPLPLVGDQGIQASGTAWSAAAASSFYFYKKRKSKGYFCSPAFLYNMLNNGSDEGIEIHRALELHKNTGCPGERYMKYKSGDYTTRPGRKALLDAPQYKIRGFGRVDFSDINQIKGHLLQNSIVIATIIVYDNFIELKTSTFKQPVGRIRGRHTVSVVGYDDDLQAFLVQNSAGKDWGKNGQAYIPYSWFMRLAVSAYVIW